jgi:1,4-alpha-glucan branching enzyme
MINWIELDEQWRQRSQQLFQRCLNEADTTKALLTWYAACQTEEKRLEWKSLCLQQQKRFGTAAAVDIARALFILDTSQEETPCQQCINCRP